MAYGKIASNIGAAQGAVLGVKGVSIEGNTVVTMGQSNVTSMTDGATVANQILTNLSQLVECVKTQADKFPQIAEIIAIRDSQVEFKAGGE